MKYINYAIFMIAVIAFSASNVAAQETETKVIDEVVAQVNDSVITLSRVRREMNEIVETSVQEGKKTREQARAEVDAKQGEIIANLINEELLIQKGKESGIDSSVDAQINQRFLEIMKQQNIKSLDTLYTEMRKSSVEPDAIRDNLRKQYTREAVFQREVDSKVYSGLNTKEIKTYYEANKSKFTKPEAVSISELFLSFAGRDENAVRAKAKELVVKARAAGADFGALVAENSDRPDAKTNKGKNESINVKELDDKFAKSLANLAVGGVTDPIEMPEGIEILRLDSRTKASSETFFNEQDVRRTLAYERLSDERRKFMAQLRTEAYIKLNETYRPLVSPILYADERKASK